MADKSAERVQMNDQRLARRNPSTATASPFGLLDQFADEMDRLFDDFGLGGSWLSSPTQRMWRRGLGQEAWWPAVEVMRRDNQLVVRADLPGLKKEDVTVDVADEAITIRGERKREQEQEDGGVYRSERSYGSFTRTIRLPEGAITDQAEATFKDGVLEITIPVPPEQVTRGRRLEITEGSKSAK